MHKGKYRHMHLFSLCTQLQLCNITEGKQQALSQLDCRAKAFFFFLTEVYGGRCQYLPKALLISGGDFKLVAFEYLSWDEGMKRAPKTEKPNDHREPRQHWEPTGACWEMKSDWLLNSGSALEKTEKFIHIGGLSCPPLSLYPGGRGLGLVLLFVSEQKYQKADTPGAHP